MVDRKERLVVKKGDSASSEGADKERAGETGAVGDGYSVEILDFESGIRKRLFNDRQDSFDMGARGDFGYDSTVGGVDVDLGDDDVAKDFCTVFDNGSSSFVAGSFDSQYFHPVIVTVLTFFARRDRIKA